MNYKFKYSENEKVFNELIENLKNEKTNVEISDLYEKTIILKINNNHFFIEEKAHSIIKDSLTTYFGLHIRKENEEKNHNESFLENQYLSEDDKMVKMIKYIKENII